MLRIVHTLACFASFSHSAFAFHDLACIPSHAHALWSPSWTLFKRAGVRRDGRHGHRLAALAGHPGLASSSPASSAPERTVTASLVEQRAVFS